MHLLGSLPLTFQVSLTAAEATALDAQLRLLLEVTYECLENGNYPNSRAT